MPDIPLVKQFLSYRGDNVTTTVFRLIALHPLPGKVWARLDTKVPVDWENGRAVPANAEQQIGRNINKLLARHVDGLVGIGGDWPCEWGVGAEIPS